LRGNLALAFRVHAGEAPAAAGAAAFFTPRAAAALATARAFVLPAAAAGAAIFLFVPIAALAAMGSAAALRGDLALAFRIHRRETAVATATGGGTALGGRRGTAPAGRAFVLLAGTAAAARLAPARRNGAALFG